MTRSGVRDAPFNHPARGVPPGVDTLVLVSGSADNAGHHVPGRIARELVACFVQDMAWTKQSACSGRDDFPGITVTFHHDIVSTLSPDILRRSAAIGISQSEPSSAGEAVETIEPKCRCQKNVQAVPPVAPMRQLPQLSVAGAECDFPNYRATRVCTAHSLPKSFGTDLDTNSRWQCATRRVPRSDKRVYRKMCISVTKTGADRGLPIVASVTWTKRW